MLMVSTFLNYFDRQALSVLKPVIKGEFGLDDSGYAHIVTGFLLTYMVFYAVSGKIVEWLGSRISMSLFVSVWSLANLLTGLSQTVGQLFACRIVLGAAEPGNYPAALRATTTWFPSKLRGLACGIYQAGSATAAVVAMPVIALLASYWGWRATFVIPGVLGLLWVVGWWFIYRAPSPEYRPQADIDGGPRIPWLQLLKNRNLWGITLARLISDQVWYFCLFWMPGYLQENLHLSLVQAGLIGWLPFLFADSAGITSGIVSDRFIARGSPPWKARRRVLIVAALFGPVAAIIPFSPNVAVAVAAMSVVAAVCQVWLFSMTTLISDVFPRTSVASVLGISGAFGAFGGMLSSQIIGAFVGRLGFMPIFFGLAFLHLIASGVIMLFIRRGISEEGSESPDRPVASSIGS